MGFRRIAESDLPFLAQVYALTRSEELAAAPLSDAQRAAFLAEQFRLQHAHYQKYYPDADWLVTMHAGEDIGRLYIERWPTQHRIIDIAFLPERRGKGFGEALRSPPSARRMRYVTWNRWRVATAVRTASCTRPLSSSWISVA
jgi:GNAT superfamily N-acetyltransferase